MKFLTIFILIMVSQTASAKPTATEVCRSEDGKTMIEAGTFANEAACIQYFDTLAKAPTSPNQAVKDAKIRLEAKQACADPKNVALFPSKGRCMVEMITYLHLSPNDQKVMLNKRIKSISERTARR